MTTVTASIEVAVELDVIIECNYGSTFIIVDSGGVEVARIPLADVEIYVDGGEADDPIPAKRTALTNISKLVSRVHESE